MKVTADRMDLMTTVEVDGVREKDPLSLNMRDFELKRKATYHRVVQDEVRRPDLLAERTVQSMAYWWFLAAINGVEDAWAMPEGVKLKIPQLLDYYDWFRSVKGTA